MQNWQHDKNQHMQAGVDGVSDGSEAGWHSIQQYMVGALAMADRPVTTYVADLKQERCAAHATPLSLLRGGLVMHVASASQPAALCYCPICPVTRLQSTSAAYTLRKKSPSDVPSCCAFGDSIKTSKPCLLILQQPIITLYTGAPRAFSA